MRPQYWRRAWKTKPWIQRLFSLAISPNSMPGLGVESWIASLRATRAKNSQWPANNREWTEIDGSANTSCELSKSCGLVISSERTSQGLRISRSDSSSLLWKGWAIALRREYSQRPKSGPATGESACSSWPTARAEDSESAGERKARGVSDTLTAASRNWPTPDAGLRGGNNQSPSPGAAVRPTISKAAEQWSTPRAEERSQHNSQDNGKALSRQVTTWQTPKVSTGAYSYDKGNPESVTLNLEGQAKQWPTFHCLPPDHPTRSGETSSSERRSLNPLFVEWLQGLPIGWTDCEPQAISLSPWLPRMRGELYRLLSAQAKTKQGDLF